MALSKYRRITVFRGFFLPCMFFFAVFVSGCAEMKANIEQPQKQQPMKEVVSAPTTFIPDGYLEPMPPIPQKGYFLSKLARNVYFFSTGTYSTMFVVTSEGVILVDPIGDKGSLIKNAIAEVTQLPVKFVIYSHANADHIGDAYLFAKGAQVIGQIETKKILERYRDARRPVPNIAFGSLYEVSFGGIKIELHYSGEGHGKGNIMIHIPDRKVLMYVDVATPKSVPFKNFSTTDIDGQIAGIQSALKLDFTVYVSGHFHRPGKREEMEEVLKYYHASRNADREAMKRVAFDDISAKSKSKDPERIMGEYYEAVANECFQILKNDWKAKLMGFEAYARSHCDVWTIYHRTMAAP